MATPNRNYRGAYKNDDFDFDDPAVRAQVDGRLQAPDPVDPDAPAPGEQLTPEDETYKKRYGDLRRHAQAKEAEAATRIKQLEQAVEAASRKELEMPTSEEELTAWIEKYPDVANIIKTITSKEILEERKTIESTRATIEDMRRDVTREKAENKIRAKHADFDGLKNDPDFHDWAKDQPRVVQAALYENDEDAAAVIRVIDLYKFDLKDKQAIKTAPKRAADATRDAASVVARPTRTAPSATPPDQEGLVYESQVKKMTPREFERHEDKIEEAIRSGKFVYDVSGAAR
jgi:hypothetical protein